MSIAEDDVEFLALDLHKQGKKLVAITLLDAAIRRNPDRGGLWISRAIARHSEADWSAALGDIETAMTLTPLPLGGQLVLADCYANTGRRELALLAYEHLLEAGSLPPDLYAGIYSGLRQCGRNDLALAACRAAVEAEPENHAAYFGMAHCMAALNYSATYIVSVLRTAVRLAPEVAAYRASLVLQLVRSRQPEEAYEQLCRVPIDQSESLSCVCSARKILQLCVWASDEERAHHWQEIVRRLSEEARRRRGRKGEGNS